MINKTNTHWTIDTDEDGIIWLTLDKVGTSTNVLSEEVLEELSHKLSDISHSERHRGIVISSNKKSGFVAGADVKEFTTLEDQEAAATLIKRGQSVLDQIENMDCPSVALIHGFCLGGGLELALACTYRIAENEPSTRLGLPEVMLGIHPGFGGTVRLPPLVGAPAAMDLMLSGRSINTRAAKKIGLIDEAIPKRQFVRAARSILLNPPEPATAKGWKAYTNHKFVRPFLAPLLRKQVAKKARADHYPAPYALIDLWLKYFDDRNTMLAEEGRSVARLVMGETSKNLVRVFFLQERMKSLSKNSDNTFKHVHVIGAGIMGGDIAAWCALQGMQVTVQDQNHEALARMVKRSYKLFKRKLKLPRLIQAAMDRLMPDAQGMGVEQADVVIEAIFENIEAKQSLYKALEPRLKPEAVLATNTSSIPLQVLSTVLEQPERLVGIHFFNPVPQMQLVEVVNSEQTQPECVTKAANFVQCIKKLPLPVTSTPGFLVNRILMPYLLEAVTIESEGVPAEVIDEAALEFGMPMGPIRLADTVGLDICLSVATILSEQLGTQVPPKLQQLVDSGKLGCKNSQGFYSYKDGKVVKNKIDKEYVPPEDLGIRLISPLLNEAVTCLREGVTTDADLVDAGIVFGTGFAPFRGGPINYITSNNVATLKKQIKMLAENYGDRFNPDPHWDDL